jgi:hypothetical protein
MKKIILVFMAILLSGCATSSNQFSNNYLPFNKTYYLNTSSDCIRYPEYIGLRQEVSEMEYRILPMHIQNCYERVE